ncbi:MAG: TetR/AcrR family transcriptional regulator [Bacteroidota bacterium]
MASPDVKSQIIESATKYFSRFGFHKTTMDEIAKNIHKAKGVLYYYFRSKEELFNEVLKQELGVLKDALSAIVRSENNSLTILTEYMLTRFRLLNGAVNYHETLKADFFEKYNFVKDVRDDFDAFEQTQLTAIIEQGNAEGYLNVKDVGHTVDVAMMIIKSIEIPLFLQDKYNSYENTLQDLINMITGSLSLPHRS